MSKIALVIDRFGERKSRVLLLVAKTFSCSMVELLKNLEENFPIIQRKIFDRRFPEFPDKLLTLFENLDALGCRWRAFELLDDQAWNSSEVYFQITPERLANMISARAASLQQQRQITSLEEGEE